MNILVIDGQGGKLGCLLIEQLKERIQNLRITAIGTNSIATSAMLKAGAQQGATGENAVAVCAGRADIILGPIAIVVADALLGEVTAGMARAVGSSCALKILIPSNRCGVLVMGAQDISPADAVKMAVARAAEFMKQEE